MSKYKLAVSNLVRVLMEGVVNTGTADTKPFKFHVLLERATTDEIAAAYSDPNAKYVDFLSVRAKGWEGQALVEDVDTGQPADFNPDAFAVLMGLSGMPKLMWTNYQAEVGAKEKTEGGRAPVGVRPVGLRRGKE